MATASIRELRNHGGEIIDRASRGESITITRNGTAVATLNPLPRHAVNTDALIERRQHLPDMDPERLRRDLDAVIDPRL